MHLSDIISIHAPRMGSDEANGNQQAASTEFQSTLPGWGATGATWPATSPNRYFNPRSPDGERPEFDLLDAIEANKFQSTLPGWGATLLIFWVYKTALQFQSTLPGWGATCGVHLHIVLHVAISIHAPRMGSDYQQYYMTQQKTKFQSTLPGWGATAKMDIFAHDMGKIIHFQH